MDIIQEAGKRIAKLPLGTKFSLDNLFTGIEWDGFEKNDRLLAGKSFFSLVENRKILNVESNGKTSANKQVYIKKLKKNEKNDPKKSPKETRDPIVKTGPNSRSK